MIKKIETKRNVSGSLHYNTFTVKGLQYLFEEYLAVTYRKKTLSRRLGLLTKKEMEQVEKHLAQIEASLEAVDNIITYRSEIERDPWP